MDIKEKIKDIFLQNTELGSKLSEKYAERVCSLFLKEYEKRKPKKLETNDDFVCPVCRREGETCGCEEFNRGLKSVDEVIYKMCKTDMS